MCSIFYKEYTTINWNKKRTHMIPEQLEQSRKVASDIHYVEVEAGDQATKRARNNFSAKGARMRTKQRHEDTAKKLIESEKLVARMQDHYKGTNTSNVYCSRTEPCEMTQSTKLLVAMNEDLAAQLRQVNAENLRLLERNSRLERSIFAFSETNRSHTRVDVYDEAIFQVFADKVFHEDYEVKCFADYPMNVLPRDIKVCEDSSFAMLNIVRSEL
jgi:hypothetical protein